MSKLKIFHFNDVYNIDRNASIFASLLQEKRKAKWGQSQGLTFFSGDAFSPSVNSPITKGKHMVEVLNTLDIKAACIGNHEFDFGIDNASNMFALSNFPWISTNLVKKKNKEKIRGTIESLQFVHNNINVGIVGIANQEWFNTIPEGDQLAISDPSQIINTMRNSVDVLIALTHQSLKKDIDFARKFPQIDLILGGHDHEQNWTQNYKIIKSGTDFEMFSEIDFDVEKSSIESMQCIQCIQCIQCTGLSSKHPDATSSEIDEIVRKYKSLTASALNGNVKTLFQLKKDLDFRERTVRSKRSCPKKDSEDSQSKDSQSNAIQRICDIVRESIKLPDDNTIVLLNGGTFRSNSLYKKGSNFTTNELNALLPWNVDLYVCKTSGSNIREIMRISDTDVSSLSGKFMHTSSNFQTTIDDQLMYTVITTDFLSNGGDGYGNLFNKKTRTKTKNLKDIIISYFNDSSKSNEF